MNFKIQDLMNKKTYSSNIYKNYKFFVLDKLFTKSHIMKIFYFGYLLKENYK